MYEHFFWTYQKSIMSISPLIAIDLNWKKTQQTVCAITFLLLNFKEQKTTKYRVHVYIVKHVKERM